MPPKTLNSAAFLQRFPFLNHALFGDIFESEKPENVMNGGPREKVKGENPFESQVYFCQVLFLFSLDREATREV